MTDAVADLRFGGMVAEMHGSGPAVVMVHGLGGTSNSFEPLMPALGGYRTLRPDLPGAGRSAPRPGRPGLAGLAAALRDFLRAHGVPQAHFVGHSMGALICQHIAAAAAELVSSLTLFGAILEPAPAARTALGERAREARAAGMAGIAATVAANTLGPGGPSGGPVAGAFVRESLLRQNPAGYAAHCEALGGARAADHAAIRCPTLLVHGAADPVAPLAEAQKLARRIAGARLETISGAGHWPMLEASERSAELLRRHLDTVDTAPVAGPAGPSA